MSGFICLSTNLRGTFAKSLIGDIKEITAMTQKSASFGSDVARTELKQGSDGINDIITNIMTLSDDDFVSKMTACIKQFEALKRFATGNVSEYGKYFVAKSQKAHALYQKLDFVGMSKYIDEFSTFKTITTTFIFDLEAMHHTKMFEAVIAIDKFIDLLEKATTEKDTAEKKVTETKTVVQIAKNDDNTINVSTTEQATSPGSFTGDSATTSTYSASKIEVDCSVPHNGITMFAS